MASPTSPTQGQFFNSDRRRTTTTSSIAHSVTSVSNSAVSFTEDLVLHHDPPLGFFAATAQVTSQAPTIVDIRRGSFGQDGWQSSGSRRTYGPGSRGLSSVSRERQHRLEAAHGPVEQFTPLTEEPASIDGDADTRQANAAITTDKKDQDAALQPVPSSSGDGSRTDRDRIAATTKDQRVYSSGYVPPPKVPWTTSTWTGLKVFWKWFCTPFGFLLTIYGLNVVAWGGMLFLLLCNASPAMCWAPVPNATNQRHMSDAAALSLSGPYYFNCNDINSPRRVWLEIDSQILNALFCVTGFGLVPWRFRDLYYLLRWRLTSEKRHGMERKMYGLRVLAGIHKGWFRLPGSDTLDKYTARQYLATSESSYPSTDIEAAPTDAALCSLPENDPRIPLPTSKRPHDPATSVRAPPTKLWKLDCFVWCQVFNTFFQCGLCGFMWGLNRYARPSWSTGLFIVLAIIVAAVGGIVSFREGKKVKRVEGVAPAPTDDSAVEGDGQALEQVRSGHESIHVDQKDGHGGG